MKVCTMNLDGIYKNIKMGAPKKLLASFFRLIIKNFVKNTYKDTSISNLFISFNTRLPTIIF